MRRASGLFRRKSRADQPPHPDDDEPGDQDNNPLVAQQKKTFRRWCNQYLVDRNMRVHHIIKDWESGVLLCNLMEVLAETSLGKINQTPKLELQKLENLNKALAFIGKHVKIVNIGSKDVLSGNQTIILGLLWTLILRWGLKLKDGKSGLLAWVSKKTAQPVTTFNQETWGDGVKMAALIAALVPGSIDMDNLSPDDAVNNFDKAFTAAEKNLGVAKLLDPADLVNNMDEKSLIAYVGAVYNAASEQEKNPPPQTAIPAAAVVVEEEPVVQEVVMPEPKVYNITPTSCECEWAAVTGVVTTKVMICPNPSNDEDWPAELGDNHRQFLEDRTSTTFEGLEPSTLYAVRCIGVQTNDKLTKPGPAVTFYTLDASAPPAPRLYDNTVDSISVSWDPVPTATEYRLMVDETADGDFAREVRVSPPETSAVVDGLTPGTANAFYVVAVLPSGKETPPSATSQGKTKLPESLETPEVYDVRDNDAMVKVAAVAGAATYELHVRKANENWDDADDKYTPVIVTNPDEAVKIKGLEPSTTYEVRAVAASAAGVATEPSSANEFVTMGPGPRYALVTEANTTASVELVQQLLLIGSTVSEPGQDTGSFGFKDGFTNVFCFSREPVLPALRELAESSRTLVVINVDLDDPKSIKAAANRLPGGINLLINNGNISRKMIMRILEED